MKCAQCVHNSVESSWPEKYYVCRILNTLCSGCQTIALENIYISGNLKTDLQQGKIAESEYKKRIHEVWFNN